MCERIRSYNEWENTHTKKEKIYLTIPIEKDYIGTKMITEKFYLSVDHSQVLN